MKQANNCANCNCDLTFAKEDGISGLYNPGPNSFRLCVDCWEAEEAVIDEDGTNIVPSMVERYARNQPEGAN